MDYTTVPELQPNPTPVALSSYPPSVAAYFPASYPPHYQLYIQNPNPSSADPQSSTGTQVFYGATGAEPEVNPPGVASYAPLTSGSVSHLTHEAHVDYSYAHNPIADSSSGYYYDPNAQNWAAREAVKQFGVDPVGYAAAIPVASTGSEQLATTANANSAWWAHTITQPHGNGARKKPSKKKKPKTKVVQSAYCEVCKIDCTSKDVLDQHKLGKKHKKNLEKLKEALKPPQVPVPPPTASSNAVTGPQPEGTKSKSGSKSKRKANETPEDLEKKKKKVLEGGAAAEAVKICTICNVVCNSETVFNYHLAGQKHAAMMKKQAS